MAPIDSNLQSVGTQTFRLPRETIIFGRANNVHASKRLKPMMPGRVLYSVDKKCSMARSKSKMPTRISPMLCTLTKEPPRNEDYLFEVKWDGYRIVSFVRHGEVRMDSRSGLNYTSRY